MITKTSTLSISCAFLLLLSLGSCRKPQDQTYAQSGLHANRIYYCDTVLHDKPLRMFSHEGEVNNAGIISQYLLLHPNMAGGPYTGAETHPEIIFSTPTTTVHYNGVVPYTASLSNGVLDLRQQDTNMYGHGTPGGPIDVLYSYEQSFQSMRNAVLDMQDSYTRLDRVDSSNYSYFESFHITGSYTADIIELPYTFVASRIMQRSYPFALKASLTPQVPVGDTLLVQEGRVEFRMR